MTVQRLEGLAFRVGERTVSADTLARGIAGNIFVLSTAVPSLGLTVHSTYHGHKGLETVIVRLVLMPRTPRQETRRVAHHEIPVTHARDRCVLDHLAYVRETMEELVPGVVYVDVPDVALAATT